MQRTADRVQEIKNVIEDRVRKAQAARAQTDPAVALQPSAGVEMAEARDGQESAGGSPTSSEQYEVEFILGKRAQPDSPDTVQYLVKYLAFNYDEMEWLDAEELGGAADMVAQFEQELVEYPTRYPTKDMQRPDEYVIEKLLAERIMPVGKRGWIVKWKGWGYDHEYYDKGGLLTPELSWQPSNDPRVVAFKAEERRVMEAAEAAEAQAQKVAAAGQSQSRRSSSVSSPPGGPAATGLVGSGSDPRAVLGDGAPAAAAAGAAQAPLPMNDAKHSVASGGKREADPGSASIVAGGSDNTASGFSAMLSVCGVCGVRFERNETHPEPEETRPGRAKRQTRRGTRGSGGRVISSTQAHHARPYVAASQRGPSLRQGGGGSPQS